MRYILILALPLWFLLSACEPENATPKHGTILKELITKNSDGEVVGRSLFKYDNAGNLTTIDDKSGSRWAIDYAIQYHNGKISWINNDSLVYENGKLIKSIYVGDDTTYIHAEFEINENLLYKKTTYSWIGGGSFFPGGPTIKSQVIDTIETVFEYDAFGNVLKTNSIGGRPLFNLNGLSNLLPSGEFSYDDKVSPFFSFPNELKFILSINPGSNNLVSQKILAPNFLIPYYTSFTYEYNLDNHPVKRKQAVYSGDITSYYKYY